MSKDLVMEELKKIREELERVKSGKNRKANRELPKITQEIGVIAGLGNGKFVVTIDDVGKRQGVHIAKKITMPDGNEIFTKNNLILPKTKETKEILMKAFKGV